MKPLRGQISFLLIVWVVFTVLSWVHVQESWRSVDTPAVVGWLTWLWGLNRYVLVPWFAALWTLAVGYIVGQFILERLGVKYDTLKMDVVAAAVGLGAVSMLTLLVGLSGWLYGPPLYVAGFLVVWAGWRRLWVLLDRLRLALAGIRAWHWMECLLLALIGWYVVRTCAITCAPAVGWDECNSHLVLPKLYVDSHAITFYEWVNFSNFPGHLDMLVTLQRLMTETPGAIWPYLYHLGTLAVVWMLVGDVFAPRHFYDRPRNPTAPERMDAWFPVDPGPLPKLLAVLLYLSIPMTTRFSQLVLTDPVLTFSCGLLVWATVHWFDRRVWGLIAGCALAVKYTAIPWVGLLFLAGMFIVPQGSPRYTLRWRWLWPTFLLMLPGLLIGLPWYIRNIVLFGNPAFPFLSGSLFPIGHGTIPDHVQADLIINRHEMLEPFRIAEPWLAPWTLTMTDTAPWVHGSLAGDIGPWLLALVPGLILVGGRLSRGAWIAISIAGIYLLWLIGWERVGDLRYGMPALPVLCALSGVVVASLIGGRET